MQVAEIPLADGLKEVCDEYIARFDRGELLPAEQGAALALMRDRIRKLENKPEQRRE